MTSPKLPESFNVTFTRGLDELIDKMLQAASERDDLDVVEANVDMAHEISRLMDPHAVAVAAAALAIRMHRSRQGVPS